MSALTRGSMSPARGRASTQGSFSASVRTSTMAVIARLLAGLVLLCAITRAATRRLETLSG